MKQMISAITAAAMIIFVGCGEKITEQISQCQTPLEQYQHILDHYYESICNGWSDWDRESFYIYDDRTIPSYLWYQYAPVQSPDEAGYRFLDIDGDGSDELIVSPLQDFADDEQTVIYDLYTYYNGQLVQLASSGSRNHFYLGIGNKIYNESSGGAAHSRYTCFCVSAGQLQLVESYIYDGYTNEANPWFYSTSVEQDDKTLITEEAFADGVEGFLHQPLLLTSFQDYASQSFTGVT